MRNLSHKKYRQTPVRSVSDTDVKPYMDGHLCEYTIVRQLTIRDVDGARILAFENACFFCGLVSNPVPIGSEVE